jgi:hypothetical protein
MGVALLSPLKTPPATVLETSITCAGRIVPNGPRSAKLGLLTIGSATAYVSINAELRSTESEQLVLATASDRYFETGSNGEDIFGSTPGPLAHGDSGDGSSGSGKDDKSDKNDSHSNQRRGMTVGITLGVIGACIICGVVIFLVAYRRRRKIKLPQNETAASSQSSLEFHCAGEQVH